MKTSGTEVLKPEFVEWTNGQNVIIGFIQIHTQAIPHYPHEDSFTHILTSSRTHTSTYKCIYHNTHTHTPLTYTHVKVSQPSLACALTIYTHRPTDTFLCTIIC